MSNLRIIQFCVVTLSVVLLSCKQPPNVEEIRKEVEEADAQQIKAFAAKDIAGMTANYADDATVLPQHSPMVTGQENIEASFKEMSSMMNEFNFSMTSFDASGDLAYEIGTYIGVFGSVADTGKYVTVWKRQDNGKWMIVADIFNTSLAPPMLTVPETKKK
ncbi:MAG: hypothetical protein A2315_13260 [Ignavibacteria bacterium RIFOXYB2_FULL_35_12]|nr:MAG: hypothetical protein A2058_09000 [Ignavibacteria bacterium GWA2_36_19]OGU54667.1 MAG: hypothetical protein A2006_03685 [Ignavibacteria bacterium GWC2_35_8]OGU60017.1 MAG: hypothetical protein A2X60_04715 [Ignavibacteria bacterium GWF2_35_20]OGU81058.1 MAG: hypothetical protein A2254_06520 [Ignavibacteria bacterium RIFOXYA2_FULL_35_9]OGU87387.1 MAG: hypothetical protein A2492_00745 [Ignavibacteria bacterium RIFOXYC12_FULL_35_11]OGU91724.1 MAG: hypothetical protein A3K31_00655 [Ignavibac